MANAQYMALHVVLERVLARLHDFADILPLHDMVDHDTPQRSRPINQR
jgi:hypothetical protein